MGPTNITSTTLSSTPNDRKQLRRERRTDPLNKDDIATGHRKTYTHAHTRQTLEQSARYICVLRTKRLGLLYWRTRSPSDRARRTNCDNRSRIRPKDNKTAGPGGNETTIDTTRPQLDPSKMLPSCGRSPTGRNDAEASLLALIFAPVDGAYITSACVRTHFAPVGKGDTTY